MDTLEKRSRVGQDTAVKHGSYLTMDNDLGAET